MRTVTKQKGPAFPGLTDGPTPSQLLPQGDQGPTGDTEALSDTSVVTRVIRDHGGDVCVVF